MIVNAIENAGWPLTQKESSRNTNDKF